MSKRETGAGTYVPYHAASINGTVTTIFDVVATENDPRVVEATVVTNAGCVRKTLFRSPTLDFMFSDNSDILNRKRG
jgi:hypothetical protein